MPDVTYTMLEEGDALNEASVNSRFTGIEAAIDDLTTDAPDQYCFNTYHLPSLVVVNQNIGPQPGPAAYTEGTTGTGVLNEKTIDSNGETGSGTEVALSWTTQTLGSGMRGILVMFDCVVESIRDTATTVAQMDRLVVISLQYHDNSASTWVTIPKTTRLVASRGLDTAGQTQEVDMNIRTLIVAGDVTNNIDGVRARVYLVEGTAHGSNTGVVLRNCHLMALGVRSS